MTRRMTPATLIGAVLRSIWLSHIEMVPLYPRRKVEHLVVQAVRSGSHGSAMEVWRVVHLIGMFLILRSWWNLPVIPMWEVPLFGPVRLSVRGICITVGAACLGMSAWY